MSRRTTAFRGSALLLVAVAGLAAFGPGWTGAGAVEGDEPSPKDPIEVQVLAVNDFHGNLEPPAGSSGRIGTIDAGGAEFLATHVERRRS